MEERIFICCNKVMLGASPLCHAYGGHCRPCVIYVIAMHDQESQNLKHHIYCCDITHTLNPGSYIRMTMKARYAFVICSRH
jgi:hypothetical protein